MTESLGRIAGPCRRRDRFACFVEDENAMRGRGIVSKGLSIETLASALCWSASSMAVGPGFGSETYTDAELGTPVSVFDASNGAEGGTNVPLLVGGYFMLHFAPDSGKPGFGIAIYDMSNPKLPKLMTQVKD